LLLSMPNLEMLAPYVQALSEHNIQYRIEEEFKEFNPAFNFNESSNAVELYVSEADYEQAYQLINNLPVKKESTIHPKPIKESAFMKFTNWIVLGLLATSITFGYLWYTNNQELKYYRVTDMMTMSKTDKHCDVYSWKETKKIGWEGCDFENLGFYSFQKQYNHQGKLLFEMNDINYDGLYEIVTQYNLAGAKCRKYEDLDHDGFHEKLTKYRNGRELIYKDSNLDGIFSDAELIPKI
ncbi:MAG: hypothetical protein KJO64_06390, partial [Bacteroidia bacterium]|nr:hypothetical protein [Bacteroidia bacterium]